MSDYTQTKEYKENAKALRILLANQPKNVIAKLEAANEDVKGETFNNLYKRKVTTE